MANKRSPISQHFLHIFYAYLLRLCDHNIGQHRQGEPLFFIRRSGLVDVIPGGLADIEGSEIAPCRRFSSGFDSPGPFDNDGRKRGSIDRRLSENYIDADPPAPDAEDITGRTFPDTDCFHENNGTGWSDLGRDRMARKAKRTSQDFSFLCVPG